MIQDPSSSGSPDPEIDTATAFHDRSEPQCSKVSEYVSCNSAGTTVVPSWGTPNTPSGDSSKMMRYCNSVPSWTWAGWMHYLATREQCKSAENRATDATPVLIADSDRLPVLAIRAAHGAKESRAYRHSMRI
jgi:hypothetical protein